MVDLSKATPRPWTASWDFKPINPGRLDSGVIAHGTGPQIYSRNPDKVGDDNGWYLSPDKQAAEQMEADAHLIVKAVNERDELLSVLRGCVDAFETIGNCPPVYDRARAVLAKADDL
jgi:hypothetical protein